MATEKKRRGRMLKPMPEHIPYTPENVAKALLETQPKKRSDCTFPKDKDTVQP